MSVRCVCLRTDRHSVLRVFLTLNQTLILCYSLLLLHSTLHLLKTKTYRHIYSLFSFVLLNPTKFTWHHRESSVVRAPNSPYMTLYSWNVTTKPPFSYTFHTLVSLSVYLTNKGVCMCTLSGPGVLPGARDWILQRRASLVFVRRVKLKYIFKEENKNSF